uniref:Uncharacterized protein n=1 Tax=Arundo donax TaxID=35708 RepID=A0A0A9B9Y8_ARUDO
MVGAAGWWWWWCTGCGGAPLAAASPFLAGSPLTTFGPVSRVRDANDALMDLSCCFWRSSSESAAAKAEAAPSLMGVVGAERFRWRECSSSMVCARTGAALSSWHTPLSCFFFPLFVSIRASPFGVAILRFAVIFSEKKRRAWSGLH